LLAQTPQEFYWPTPCCAAHKCVNTSGAGPRQSFAIAVKPKLNTLKFKQKSQQKAAEKIMPLIHLYCKSFYSAFVLALEEQLNARRANVLLTEFPQKCFP